MNETELLLRNLLDLHQGGRNHLCRSAAVTIQRLLERNELLLEALNEKNAAPFLENLVCVGKAKFPRNAGNAGLAWYVDSKTFESEGFRVGSPANSELLFVIPTEIRRHIAARKDVPR